jgi:hypothetical protein
MLCRWRAQTTPRLDFHSPLCYSNISLSSRAASGNLLCHLFLQWDGFIQGGNERFWICKKDTEKVTIKGVDKKLWVRCGVTKINRE